MTMYEILGNVTGGLILVCMLMLAATLSGAAAMGIGHDRVTFTFDIAKITKRAFLGFLVMTACILASLGATVWYGWREGVFDGVDKRGSIRPARVDSKDGRNGDRVHSLQETSAVPDVH